MPAFINLIRELKAKAPSVENREDMDAVRGTIWAIKRGAEAVIVYDKFSGLVRIYDVPLVHIIAEGDRLDAVDCSVYETLREMDVVLYIANSETTVIGLKSKAHES